MWFIFQEATQTSSSLWCFSWHPLPLIVWPWAFPLESHSILNVWHSLFPCLFLYPQFIWCDTIFLTGHVWNSHKNSKIFSDSLLILKIYFLLGFKDLHSISQSIYTTIFCLTLYQGLSLEPRWCPRNPSLKAQQAILGLGTSSHSPFLLPQAYSRSPCSQPCLILRALPALPFSQACELLCPPPGIVFPRLSAQPAHSHPLVLRVNITPWTGIPGSSILSKDILPSLTLQHGSLFLSFMSLNTIRDQSVISSSIVTLLN